MPRISLTWFNRSLAALLFLVAAICPPALVWFTERGQIASELDSESRMLAIVVSRYIGHNPGIWSLTPERLEFAIRDLVPAGRLVSVERGDGAGVLRIGLPVESHPISRSRPLELGTETVGRLTLEGSLKPAMDQALRIGILAVAIAAAATGVLWLTVLRVMRQAAARVQESRNRFRTLTELSNDGYWAVDADMRFTDLSRGMERFGLSAANDLGARFYDPPRGFAADSLAQLMGKVNRREGYRNEEVRGALGDQPRHVLLSAEPSFAPDGTFLGYLGTATDITDRKLAEEQLRESARRLQDITDNLPALVGHIDKDQRYVFVNRTYEDWYGVDRKTILGRTVRDVLGGQRYAIVKANIERVLSGELVQFHGKFPLPDGKVIDVLAHYIPSRDGDGNVDSYYLLLDDVTQIKSMEEELRTAYRAATEASRAKSEFLANMSHEIRTPLNGVLGMLQLLELTSLDAEQQEYIKTATKASRRLTELLTDILDLSRIEAGKLRIRVGEFDPRVLASHVRDIFEPAVKEKGIAFKVSVDPGVPRALLGDEARLTQILFNIVGNAVKFTRSGGVTVHIEAISKDARGRTNVMFTVADTGIGLTPDQIKVIFEPFTQVDNTCTRPFQGAGLGLAIVRKLLGLMDGELYIDETEGGGATMHLCLPFDTPESDPGRAAATAEECRAPARPGLRVLLVEDDEVSLAATRTLLQKAGLAVAGAENGGRALEMLAADDFDVVLMDIQMPVLDGLNCVKSIRTSPALGDKRRIPIIALTAHAMLGDRERFLEAGMDGYVSKPFKLRDLMDAIARLTL